MSAAAVRVIEEWAVEPCEAQTYQAPEIRDHIHVAGKIGGKCKLTSQVVSVDGRTIRTKTGSIYQLGEPSEAYRKFLASIGYVLDEEHPIKLDVVRPKRRRRAARSAGK